MLAASLVDLGMSWWQGVLAVFAGNVVVLVPMVLNAHAGTKFGVPFPVLARASFGIRVSLGGTAALGGARTPRTAAC